MLDENLLWNRFHPTQFSSFSSFYKILQTMKMPKLIQCFIQHGKILMLDKMLDLFGPIFREEHGNSGR